MSFMKIHMEVGGGGEGEKKQQFDNFEALALLTPAAPLWNSHS